MDVNCGNGAPRQRSTPPGSSTAAGTEGCPLDASGQSGQQSGQGTQRQENRNSCEVVMDGFLDDPPDSWGGVEGGAR